MKKLSFIIPLGILSAAATAQVAPTFKHVRNIDLSSQFVTAGDYGDTVGDVTTDGTDLYAVGFINASPTAGKVGILKIADPLGAETKTKLYSTADSPGVVAAAGGRETHINFANNALFMTFGMGETQPVAPSGTGWRNSACMRWAFSTNQHDGTWASIGYTSDLTDTTPGFLTSAEINGSLNNRVDGMAIDPIGGNRIAFACRARGAIFRFLDGNGTNAGNLTNTGNLAFAGNGRLVRGIAFNASGDLFARVNNDVYLAKRNASGFDVEAKIIDLPAADTQMVNIAYVPATATSDEFIVINDRSTGTIGTSFANIYQHNSSGVWSNVASITLNGSEAIGGTGQTAWSVGNVLSFKAALIGGKSYLLASDTKRVDMYEITGPTTAVSGQLSVSGYSGPNFTSEVFTAKVYSGATLVDTQSFNCDANGNYTFQTTASGTVDIKVSGDSTLARRASSYVLGSGPLPSFVLLNGDIVDDGVVDLTDYTYVVVNFNKVSTDPDWNTADGSGISPAMSDVTGDGTVDLSDYTEIVVNFNAVDE